MKNKFFVFLCSLIMGTFSVRVMAIHCQAGYYVGPGDLCAPCPIGTYNPTSTTDGINACVSCPIDTYNQNTGQEACIECPTGSTTQNNTGSDSYQDCKCAAGMFMSDVSPVCKPCTNPAYTSHEGTVGRTSALACTICNAGYQLNTENVCVACPVGMYKPLPDEAIPRSLDDNRCHVCPGGSYAPTTGMSECLQCPTGHCCSGGRRYQCNKGTWAGVGLSCQSGGGRALEGLSFQGGMCTRCSGGCTTAGKGAESQSECTIKTAKRFCIDAICFSWPNTGEITEQPLNSSISTDYSCPGGAMERD